MLLLSIYDMMGIITWLFVFNVDMLCHWNGLQNTSRIFICFRYCIGFSKKSNLGRSMKNGLNG